MKFSVKYQSRGGNTRAVAEVIAGTLGVKAEPVDTPTTENVDILFIGGALYAWRIDKKLRKYLDKVESEKIGKIAVFGTSGGQENVIKKITEYAAKKGLKADERSLYLPMKLQGNALFGRKGGNLNNDQINKIKEFANGFI
jgi:menaquinone-dependent protoporphyrinogen IX oxidase